MRLERIPGLRQAPALLAPQQRDLVLFDAWRGTYSDNPRAISERLRDLRPDLRQVWVADETATGLIPAWAGQVRALTRGHLAALGSASYVVTNIGMPGYYRKPGGARYLQTWHGSPLKRIAHDIRGPAFTGDPKFFDLVRRDVARWDALVSPNPWSTEIFRSAFRYEGPVLETGYPRNDLLSAPEAPALRESVRRSLGLTDETRAVLYAPTWRDSRSFDLELDLDELNRRLGPGHAVLLRTHPHAPAPLTDEQRALAIDVSTHPDIRLLYLAADVLVTDYSSVMSDFAVTRKPILLFTYDLAHYRDELRGFYFDLEADAPGPLLTTTAELADALEDLDAVTTRYAASYDAFHTRFCALEDGRASDRVVEAFFQAR